MMGILGRSSDLRGSYEEIWSLVQSGKRLYKGFDHLVLVTKSAVSRLKGSFWGHAPIIAESVTQFQAQAYKELLPAGGPFKLRSWVQDALVRSKHLE